MTEHNPACEWAAAFPQAPVRLFPRQEQTPSAQAWFLFYGEWYVEFLISV